MSGKRRQRRYRRLDRAERAAIERGLDKNRSAREMARDLGRSQSSVADEVRRNRTVSRGPAKGERVESVPEGACARLKGWPHVCNGCNKRRYHCGRPFRCEYSAARAQGLADGTLSDSRRGVDRSEGEFERIAAAIRADLARGLSPAQISAGRSREFRAAPSTIYRWIDRGYAGMSNMELRRKVGYKERRKGAPRPTSHGPERSFAAFSALPEAAREAACEMDTVIGRSLEPAVRAHALPALLPRPGAAASAREVVERGGRRARHAGDGRRRGRLPAHARAGPHRQRGGVLRLGVAGEVVPAGCGRPLQSVLLRREAVPAEGRLRAQPRGAAGSSCPRAAAYRSTTWSRPTWRRRCRSSTPSPRPSMAFMAPARALLAAYGDDGAALMDALGMEEVPYGELLMGVEAIDRARRERGSEPLA